jgi:hypothetical protein
MKLDDDAKQAVQNLGDSINSAVGASAKVAEAIEHLRRIGYEPHLTLRLEIALERTDAENDSFDFADEESAEDETKGAELELTEEDLRTLQRMKIRF